MTVPQLRKICKGRHIVQGGLKDELVKRLENDDKGRTEIKFITTTPKRSRGGSDDDDDDDLSKKGGHPPPSKLLQRRLG